VYVKNACISKAVVESRTWMVDYEHSPLSSFITMPPS